MIVSGVCPRRKTLEVIERIDALNAGLQVLCSDLQVDFVDNNPAFYLQDGSFTDGFLLADKVHLTRAASNNLDSNLRLELCLGHTTVHTDHWRRGYIPDTPSYIPSDESDPFHDDDLSAIDAAHPSWQKVVYKSRPWQSSCISGKLSAQKPHRPTSPHKPRATVLTLFPARPGSQREQYHRAPRPCTRTSTTRRPHQMPLPHPWPSRHTQRWTKAETMVIFYGLTIFLPSPRVKRATSLRSLMLY